MRTIQRAYRTKLKPTPEQAELLGRHAGAARFMWNWALERNQKARETWEALPEEGRAPMKRESSYELAKVWSRTWPTDFPHFQGISSRVANYVFKDVDQAFQNFFRRLKKGEKPGFPRFKSRSRNRGKFTVQNVRATEKGVRLPVIGEVETWEKGYLNRNEGKVLRATVVEQRDGHWYVSLLVEESIPEQEHPAQDVCLGVDLGISTLAVVSDGRTYENPRPLKRLERKLARLQRVLSRRKKGSSNRRKAKAAVAKLHERVRDIRQHHLHLCTTDLTRSAGVICLEDLAVANMKRNRHLAKAVSDASMSEFKRQVAYKVDWKGGKMVLVGRYFPSTKTCSTCGHVKEEMPLKERVYHCEICGLKMCRDLNAALNIREEGIRIARQENPSA